MFKNTKFRSMFEHGGVYLLDDLDPSMGSLLQMALNDHDGSTMLILGVTPCDDYIEFTLLQNSHKKTYTEYIGKYVMDAGFPRVLEYSQENYTW